MVASCDSTCSTLFSRRFAQRWDASIMINMRGLKVTHGCACACAQETHLYTSCLHTREAKSQLHRMLVDDNGDCCTSSCCTGALM